MRLITGMVVIGDEPYYDMAAISVPSFLRSNPESDLVVFTDRPDFVLGLCPRNPEGGLLGHLFVQDMRTLFLQQPDLITELESKINHGACDFKYATHLHKHINIAVVVPFLQDFAARNGYDYALKVDTDSFFIGDLIGEIERETGEWIHMKDMMAVENCHPAMANFDGVAVCAGFMMWRTSCPYARLYRERFAFNEQATWWSCLGATEYMRPIRFYKPGWHFIGPFLKNPAFTKEDALKYAPAYYHLQGDNIIEQMQLLDTWFNPETKFNLTNWR